MTKLKSGIIEMKSGISGLDYGKVVCE